MQQPRDDLRKRVPGIRAILSVLRWQCTRREYPRISPPFLQGTQQFIYPPGQGNGFELFGHNAFISGNWKITRLQEPYGDFSWGLYDLNTDPAELKNLADQYPDKFQELLSLYLDYEATNGVIQVPEGWRMFENLGTSRQQ